MKKIVLIQNNIQPYRLELWNLIGDIDNVEFTVLTKNSFQHNEPLKFKNSSFDFLKMGSFVHIRNWRKILKEYDLIILPFDFHFIDVFWLFAYKKKVVLYGHGIGKNKRLLSLRLALVKRYKLIALYSNQIKDRLIDLGVSSDKIITLKNTLVVHNAGMSQHRRKHFLFVGRLQYRKRIDLMILEFKKIINSIPNDVNLFIVGKADNLELEKELLSLVKNSKLENRVIFLGKVTDNDRLKELFGMSLAYLCPDNGGLGIVHSFLYGTPVIIRGGSERHGPEYENIINEKNAFVYNNEDELRHFMVKLANNPSNYSHINQSAFDFYQHELSPFIYIKSFKTLINKMNL